MRKRVTLLTILMLVLVSVIGIWQVQAQSSDDRDDLAQYYAQDSLAFVSARIDDAYVETLNGVIDQVRENTGGLLPADFVLPPVPDLLDEVFFSGAAAQNGVELDWIGDTVAAGIGSFNMDMMMEDEPELLIAVAIEDREAALGAVQMLIADADGEAVEFEDTTIYVSRDGAIAVGDEALFFGVTQAAVESALTRGDDNLAASERFTKALAALPVESYNITGYFDAAALNETMVQAMSSEEMGMMGMTELFTSMGVDATASGQIAFGLTILDGRTLTIDMAQRYEDPEAIMAMPGFTEQAPVNMDFAARLPGYTQLLIWDADFKSDFEATVAAFDAVGPMLQAFIDFALGMEGMGDMDTEFMDPGEAMVFDLINGLDLTTVNFGQLIKHQIIPIFAGFTGLNLEDDVIAWMTEDVALTTSLIPVDGDLGFSLDITLLAGVGEDGAATAVVEQLAEAAEAYYLGGTLETGDVTSLTFSDLLPFILAEAGLPQSILEDVPELDFVIAANDDVAGIGSRPGVDFALDPQGSSLMDNETFQYAQTVLLEDATSVWYVSGTTLARAIPALAPILPPDTPVEDLQFIVAQVESMTISAAVSPDFDQLTRATITLPESVPYELSEPDMGDVSVQILGADESVYDVILNNGNLGLLNSAIDAAGLQPALTDADAALTLFAPTDAAFAELAEELGVEPSALLDDTDQLTDILTYHVVEGFLLAEILETRTWTTLNGEELDVVVNDDGTVTVNGAMVLLTNLVANNGVVHIIDTVLMPPSMQE